MEDVDPHHHQVFQWNAAAPKLTTQLAVDLESDLLDDAADLQNSGHKRSHQEYHLLLVTDRLDVDDLTGNRLLHTAQLLYCRVPEEHIAIVEDKSDLVDLLDLSSLGVGMTTQTSCTLGSTLSRILCEQMITQGKQHTSLP